MIQIRDSVVLITGGTGSFGRRFATRLMRYQPAEIRIFSRDEKKQWEMQKEFPGFRYLLGDVRDASRLDQVMDGVDYVFHAAALKQVPSCEAHPFEALQTNSIGSQYACECAKRHGVKKLVAISTDKAVKPINVMGVSKAMMEKIVCNQNRIRCETVFSCVRYGNVMGSRGSVIPLFLEQIREGRPMTITVPQMTRFLLTLDEAIDLVFHAFENAQGGEIFVRKAPACTIQVLAETMRLRHSPKGAEHPITIIGVRQGEKIHEVLVNEYEMLRATEDRDFFVIQPEYRGLRNMAAEDSGREYTSLNTIQLTQHAEIDGYLERMGEVESFS